MANESISVLKTKEYSFPNPKRTRIYRLLSIGKDNNGNLICPNSLTVPNTFLINDKGQPKSYTYVSHLDPSTSSDSIPKSQRGKIEFTLQARGQITIYGDRPEMALLDQALYFHQCNKTNIGESWHIRPRTGEYLFERVDRQKKAELDVQGYEREQECFRIIKDMSVPSLRDAYEVVLKISSEGLSIDEIKKELYVYIKDGDNAKNFLSLSKSAAMENKAVLAKAYPKKIIKNSKDGQSVVWVKGGELLCNKLPNKSLQQSLLSYFITDEGKQVLETLKALTEAKEE